MTKETRNLKREVTLLKKQCRQLSHENLLLKSELADIKFVNKNLLGVEISPEEIAAEQHESELVNAMGSYLGDDF